MDWQTMETAPKDETVILIHKPEWKYPYVAHWYEYSKLHSSVEDGYCLHPHNNGPQHPTHWMPLPEPPVLKSPDVQKQEDLK